MSGSARRRVLLTIGDPNGVGPEVAVKAAAESGEVTRDTAGSPPSFVTMNRS